MKATKFFLILLAVVALFAFACKTDDEPIVEEAEIEELTETEQWVQDITAFLETWEDKTEFSMEEVIEMTEQLQPMGEKVVELDLENTTEGEQKEEIEALMKRVDELMERASNTP